MGAAELGPRRGRPGRPSMAAVASGDRAPPSTRCAYAVPTAPGPYPARRRAARLILFPARDVVNAAGAPARLKRDGPGQPPAPRDVRC